MRKTMMLSLCLVVALPLAVTPAAEAGGVEATAALDQLKSLAGTWSGSAAGEGEAKGTEETGKVVHDIQVSAAGTVVMETMNPGTEHEMINMYHLDGEDLVLTHYCASGNQPTMRLNREQSTASKLVFDFTGGTNLDPAVDTHIHSAVITMKDGGKVESSWTGYAGGEQRGVMTFNLARGE